MKLALIALALAMPVLAQTPAPPTTPSTPQPAPSTPAPAAATPSTPPQTTPPPSPTPAPATAPKPAIQAGHGGGPGMVQPPPPPENHNGPAYKNPKSTLPKVVGLPHVLYSLKYIDTKVGTGPLAEPHKFYTVNYTGWFTDGTKFDSSYDHTPKEPITFPYGAQRVIIGWDTGFEGMRLGGKRRLYVPYQLAYGLTGRAPKMGPKANLIFDVELINQSDKPPAGAAGTRPPTRPMPGGQGAPGMRMGAPATPSAPGTPATPPPASSTPATPTTPTSPSTAPAPTPAQPATPPSTPAPPATPPSK